VLPCAALAALWAVHPVSTEAVTNIVGRADLLAALGVLGALYSHVRAADMRGTSRLMWRTAEVAAATLAVFSKESGVAVLPAIVLHDVLLGRDSASKRRQAFGIWIALAVPVALLLYQRSVVAPPGLPPEPFVDNPISGSSFWTGRLTALAVVGRYLWLTFWPATLSADYSHAQIPLATGTAQEWMAWLTVSAALCIAVFLVLRSYRLAFFAAGFAFLTLLPGANLLFPTGTIMAERLLYLPLAGLVAVMVIAGSTAVAALAHRPPLRTAAACLVIVVVAALSVRTWVRNRDWRDDVAFWTSAVHAAPNSFKTHKGLANALYRQTDDRSNLPQVVAEAERAVAILDSVPDALNVMDAYRAASGYQIELGDRLQREGRDTEAGAAYRRAAQLMERYLAIVKVVPLNASGLATGKPVDRSKEIADASLGMASAYLRQENPEGALDAARRSREALPFEPAGYRLSAAALVSLKRLDEAAVLLLTGFTLTGDAELRQAVLDLYQSDPGPRNCAVKKGREGDMLDPACPMVRDHLCNATFQAIAIQRRHGRTEQADQLHQVALQSYGCQVR
jgi:tetratricopeptide (TPR) repeat protein